MFKRGRYILVLLLAGIVNYGIFLPVHADDTTTDPVLVDQQKTAVATNLGLFGGQPKSMVIDPLSNTVYMATLSSNGIFVSTDAGANWQGLPATANYGLSKAVTLDPATGTAYALVGDSLLQTTDHGATWTDDSAGLTKLTGGMDNVVLFAHNLLFVTLNNGSIAVSSDNGKTFTSVLVQQSGRIMFLAAAKTASTFYAVTQVMAGTTSTSTLWRSVDNGKTWTDMSVTSKGIPSSNLLYGVGVDPNNDNDIVVTADAPGSDSYHSLDGGASWTILQKGTDAGASSKNIMSNYVTFDVNDRLYLGQYYTENPQVASPSWTALTTTTPLSSIYGDVLAADPTNPKLLYTNSGMGVAKSIDAGQTWTDNNTGITAVQVYALSQATNKDVMWVGASGGLAKSTNFTSTSPTWQYPIVPIPGISAAKAVWVKPDDPNIVVAGAGSSIAYSTDAGTTWQQSAGANMITGWLLQIQPSQVDVNTLYAMNEYANLAGADTGTVLKSTDLGKTWTDLTIPNKAPSISLGVLDDDTLLVGVGGDSIDQGLYQYKSSAWTKLTNDLSNQAVGSIVVDSDQPDVAYATVETSPKSNIGLFYKSTDRGATWTKISNGLSTVNNLGVLTVQTSSSPHTLYVAGQDTKNLDSVIYKSSDAGSSWALYYEGLKQDHYYALFFDGVVAGNGEGLFNMQSRASLKLQATPKTVQKGKVVHLTAILKDASTKTALANRRVTFYQKHGKKWKAIGTAKTNKMGKATFSFSPKANVTIEAKWKPNKTDVAAYTSLTTSSTVRVLVK